MSGGSYAVPLVLFGSTGGGIVPLLHKIAGVVIVCAVVLGLTLPGERRGRDGGSSAERAGAASRAAPGAAPAAQAAKAGATPAASASGTASPSASASAPIPAAAPAAVAAKANELGQVPVLMYHRILKKPELSPDI